VLHQLHDQINDDKFADIRDDIFAIRAPPSGAPDSFSRSPPGAELTREGTADRLLNAILRGADVVAQVSTREGYEIKVSEAVHKGKWVIAAKCVSFPSVSYENGERAGLTNGRRAALEASLSRSARARMASSSSLPTRRVRRFPFLSLSPSQIQDLTRASLLDAGIANALIDFYSSDKRMASRSEMTVNDVEHVRGGRLCVSSSLWVSSPRAPSSLTHALDACCSGDGGDGPSERDLSVGNATMWHVLFSRLLGITGHVTLSDSQRALCEKLGIDIDGKRPHDFEGLKGEKVWEVLVKAFDGDKKRDA